jgi:integrase
MAKILTDISIKKLKPGSVRMEIPDGGCKGLRVIVQPTGVRSFALRYRYAGKPAKLTIGPIEIGLAAARKIAADAQLDLTMGRDPSAVKRTAKQAEQTAGEYLKREGSKLRTMRRRVAVRERVIFPAFGARPIGAIKRSEIVRLLDKIEETSGPAAADDALKVIRKIMNWHATRSDDFRSPIVRGMTRSAGSARTRILTDDEIRAVWSVGDKEALGPLVRFLLLTACRRSEAAEMTWTEIDGADWLLPASRNKTGLDLLRPLSKAARDLIAKLPKIEGSAFVFTGTRGGISRRKERFDSACGIKFKENWTIHDLRRTARSLMSRAGVNTDHAERCLGHVIGGVRGVYDRHEFYAEKQHAYEALAAQIERIVDPPPNNVVTLKAQG